MTTPSGTAPLMLFDGVCNLCNGSVQFVLRHERASELMFAAMQSETGREKLTALGLPLDNFDSFILIRNEAILHKSRAAFAVLRYLRLPWSLLAAFEILPRLLTDFVYDRIAQNRYCLFGRRDACMLPTKDLTYRFLP